MSGIELRVCYDYYCWKRVYDVQLRKRSVSHLPICNMMCFRNK